MFANYDDVRDQLLDAGLRLDGELEVDTPQPVRTFENGGDRERRGWYWLSSRQINGQLFIIGACGIYRGADAGKIALKLRLDGKAVSLTSEEREAIRAQQRRQEAKRKAMRKAKGERAALKAQRLIRLYQPEGASDYLERKGVGAHGLRFAPSGNGTIAVPMRDTAGTIHGVQIIRGKDRPAGKREKEYWPAGVAVAGHFHLIGPIPGRVILVAEGYATAATLLEATGLPVAVAFDANNLLPVAKELARAYKAAHLLICADDDYLQRCRACQAKTPVAAAACRHCGAEHGASNPGVSAAERAAFAVGGAFVAPVFAGERSIERKGPTDFNDLAAAEGLPEVRSQVEAVLRAKGWIGEETRAAGASNEGAGGREALPSMIQIEEALERYALVYGAKDTVFDTAECCLVPKSCMLDMLPEHGWRDFRARKRVVRLGEVGFDPAGTDPNITCNLWGGWPTESAEGECSSLLWLLEFLCSNEPNGREIYNWVLRWLAYPLQHPGAKMRTALVFHGPQGSGKNLFFESIMAMYGDYGRIIDQSAIEDKFNDWASRKLFLIADEVVARAELFHTKNKLKGLITGEWIRINPKNVAAHDERNHVNIVFLSNETQPLVLERDDRRYTVIWTPDKRPDKEYALVREEIDAGGIAALHHYLLNLELGEFNEHTKPPPTHAKMALIEVGMGSVERFLADWASGDVFVNAREEPLPFVPCGSADLYQAYLRWARINGVSKPREQNQFMATVCRRPGWSKGHKDRYETLNTTRTIRQRMVIPSEQALTEQAAAGRPDFRRPAEKTLTQWLTECFFEFRAVLDTGP